ncbi:glycosyltransferase family 4 protein [Arenimonas composti]|nr:glycosyltransferase family 4 protein [Arenimonas composti]
MKLVLFHTNADYLIGLRLPLMKYLVREGLEVVCYAPNMSPSHLAILSAKGIRGETYEIDSTGMNPVRDVRNLFGMVGILRRERPDIVLSNNAKPVVWGTIAAWLARVPQRYCLVGGLGYAFITIGGQTLRRRFTRWAMKMLYSLAFRSASGVIFQNPDDLAEMVESGICPARKAHVVNGSGVEIDHYSPVDPPVADPVFVMVGRLIAEKGAREYLQAAERVKQRHPGARFMLLGDIDDNPSALKPDEVARFVDAGVVEWPGAVRDVPDRLRQASVFVLPSYYREGVPRSALEAMATALPVITTDLPGCRETVRDGRNGILVPPRDVDALAAAMLAMCEDPGRRQRMGAESRRIALERFDAEAVNAEMGRIMGIRPGIAAAPAAEVVS